MVIVPPPRIYPPYGYWPFYGVGFYASPFWSVYGYGGGTFESYDESGPTGGLRLQIEPQEAEVFVDGYFAGLVNEINGRFNHLNLAPGPHHIEVRAPGYETLEVDVNIEPHHTIHYRGALVGAVPR